ncbi:MAG: 2-oxo acid dehydrogenase subunit E2 [Cytophagaceae bacterium]|nr:2-oxo acid dehydrogenase subunit E2 [Cytophagaceae bacterium]MDW8455642.1 dihydrolipoamide acetyltransferase family protein [Cytophagaceae bacterium]
MATVEMVMPKMGESIMEGTILNWLKKVGDKIERDESVLEVATDKVDTEVPATHSGILKQILADKGQVVPVGAPIAIIETEDHQSTPLVENEKKQILQNPDPVKPASNHTSKNNSNRFYSPLVMNIAKQEGISMDELELIEGSGLEGRVTKSDILNYLKNRKTTTSQIVDEVNSNHNTPSEPAVEQKKTEEPNSTPSQSLTGNYEIIVMDRMRKIIAERMVESKKISPHVTSFVEADVTNIVYWRNRYKQEFMEKEGVALTLTPIFIEAVVKAIKDYPLVNISVEGDKIIVKKDINIGMAVALPSGNLIVPVIKNADQLNIVGITKKVNDLAKRARANKLTPDDLSGGTYTISNVGSFGNLMGTPIIMQPQCAILALGAVVKKPAVIESPQGDTIGIRHMMFLSHSYDHRVIDGALGGMFVRRVADYLEAFDANRKVF